MFENLDFLKKLSLKTNMTTFFNTTSSSQVILLLIMFGLITEFLSKPDSTINLKLKLFNYGFTGEVRNLF